MPNPIESPAMTFAAFLNETHKRIWSEERAVLQRGLDVLSGWEAAPADVDHLRRALQQLDELFLLVVVGEFNSGKSALINALLGEAPSCPRVQPRPPTASTSSHGQPGAPEFVQDDVRLLRYAGRPAAGRYVDRRHPRDERRAAATRGHRPRLRAPQPTWCCSSPPPTGRSTKASAPSSRASASGARRSSW
jgi:hypothetical protein